MCVQLDGVCEWFLCLPISQVSADGNWMHILFQSRLQAKKVATHTTGNAVILNNLHVRISRSNSTVKTASLQPMSMSLSPSQALSKNGKVYGNGIMIGVQPCIDKVSRLCRLPADHCT